MKESTPGRSPTSVKIVGRNLQQHPVCMFISKHILIELSVSPASSAALHSTKRQQLKLMKEPTRAKGLMAAAFVVKHMLLTLD